MFCGRIIRFFYDHTIIQKHLTVTGLTLPSVALTLLIALSVFHSAPFSNAEDTACGDAMQVATEQCDDGNTASGDGCSGVCTIEVCGNTIVDIQEQCDDGNTASGDGCSSLCRLEFCGDTVVTPATGEECDDGNTASGDGCSSICRQEAPTPTLVVPPQQTSTTPKPLSVLVKEALYFLSPTQKTVLHEIGNFTPSDEESLQKILTKLKSGPLTPDERLEVDRLISLILANREADKKLLLNLLTELFGGFVGLEGFSPSDLALAGVSLDDIDSVINFLRGKVEPLRGAKLQAAVQSALARLQAMDPELFSGLPPDLQEKLAGTPLEVLEAVAVLKPRLLSIATTDLPSSLTRVQTDILALKQSTLLLEREFGIDAKQLDTRLDAFLATTEGASPNDLSRVVALKDALLGDLRKHAGITSADIAAAAEEQTHAAARAERLSEGFHDGGPLKTEVELVQFTKDLAAKAPAEFKNTFAEGSVADQRVALQKLLSEDSDTNTLREKLVSEGNREAQDRYEVLLMEISRIGDGADTGETCDDDSVEALRCIDAYMQYLESVAENKSLVTKAASKVRNFFGIDQ